MRLKAINSIQRVDPTGAVDVVGYGDDGLPIIKKRIEHFDPGDEFEIEDTEGQRLVNLGAATTELGYENPVPEAA